MYEFLSASTNEIILEYNDKYEKLTHDELAPLCRQGDLDALYEMGSRCCLGLDGEKVDAPAARQFFEKILSMQRNARAVYLLGEMYRDGEFGEENKNVSRECYEYGYLWGDARSAEKLGVLYELGEFVEKDIDKAIGLYKEAIEKGNEHAFFSLGDLYLNIENYYSARECLEKAVEADDYSYILLGNIYEDGLGVKQDHEKARKYYEKAYESGLTDAAHYLGRLYLLGNGVSEDIDKAREYFEEAVNGGMTSSNYGLGSIYIHYAEQGVDVDNNIKKGIEALNKAPEDLHDRTYQMLGIAYKLLGDTEKAREYFSEALALGNKAAESELNALDQKDRGKRRAALMSTNIAELEKLYEDGDEDTIFPIANSYHKGINGAPVNPIKAYEYYSELCKRHLFGEQHAMYAMAALILDGKIDGIDKSEGVRLLKELDKKGYSMASVLLGEIYRRGLHGVTQSFEKAVDCYKKAVADGNVIGKCCLAEMYFMGKVNGKQEMANGINLLKEVLSAEPNNESARWYMSCFELNGATDNGITLVEKNRLHALTEMEQLSSNGHLDAIKRLAEIYGNPEDESYDLEKASKYNMLLIERGEYIGAATLAAINILDDYKEQTISSNEAGVEYAKLYIEKSAESRGLKEMLLTLMMMVYQKRGLDTDYSKEGMKYIFSSFERYPYEYFSEEGLKNLTNVLEFIYPLLGSPYERLKDISRKNSYIGRAASGLLSVDNIGEQSNSISEVPANSNNAHSDNYYKFMGGVIFAVFILLLVLVLWKPWNNSDRSSSIDTGNNTSQQEYQTLSKDETEEVGKAQQALDNTFVFKDGYGNEREMDIDPDVQKNVYSNDNFIISNGRVSYEDDTYTSISGVDVSKFQGNIDWNAVKNDGIDFCFIRIGNRGYSEGAISLDSEFINNIEGAKNAGLDVGVYFFSQAINEQEAIEEADFVVNNVNGYDLELPIAFNTAIISKDDSRTKELSNEQLSKNAKAFCDRIDSLGYEAALYTDMASEAYIFDMSEFSDYITWYSDYNSDIPQSPYAFKYWQYSNKGKVAGISTDVDLDLLFVKKEISGEAEGLAVLSDEDICQIVRRYYNTLHNIEPQYVEIDSIDGDIVTIHLYDVVIDDADTGEGHTATYDWYSIDRKTLTGTNLLGEEIDLNEFKSS